MSSLAFVNWHKSSRSGGTDNCVEIGEVPGFRGMRDTKLGQNGPIIAITAGTFNVLMDHLRSGRFHG